MSIREIMVFATDFKLMGLGRQVVTLNTTLTLTSHEKPGPVGGKKAPPSQWEVELLKKLISTDMGHCDLFEWL
jgi:hypothetical protein